MPEKTMTVKLTINRIGPEVSENAGDEVELPAAEAKRLLSEGAAVPVARAKVQRAETR